MVFPPAFDAAWDDTFPPDSQQANQLGADIRNFKRDIRERHALLSGTLANRPSNMDATFGGAGYGAIYLSTDTGQVFQWNGAAWVDLLFNQGRMSNAGSVLVTNPRFVALYLNNTGGAGDVDFLDSSTAAAYVVPANKVAIIGNASIFNGNALLSSNYIKIKVGGVYYRVTATQGQGTLAQSVYGVGPLILNAGEGLAINATQTNQNALARCIEVDAGSLSLKQGRVLTLLNGDNVLYTCPGGKTAAVLSASGLILDVVTNSSVIFVNDSGGTLTYTLNVVRNAGVPGATNKQQSIALTDKNRLQFTTAVILNAGDFININTTSGTATQTAWVLVIEL